MHTCNCYMALRVTVEIIIIRARTVICRMKLHGSLFGIMFIWRSIESLGRHVHSYPVQMGPSIRHRRKGSISVRGDVVSRSHISFLAEIGPGSGSFHLFLIDLDPIHFFTFPYKVDAFFILFGPFSRSILQHYRLGYSVRLDSSETLEVYRLSGLLSSV